MTLFFLRHYLTFVEMMKSFLRGHLPLPERERNREIKGVRIEVEHRRLAMKRYQVLEGSLGGYCSVGVWFWAVTEIPSRGFIGYFPLQSCQVFSSHFSSDCLCFFHSQQQSYACKHFKDANQKDDAPSKATSESDVD